MTTREFIGGYKGVVHYIDSPVFIFSPVPIIVDMPNAPDGYPYEITVTNSSTGESFSETRVIHNGKAHFEISRILQYLVSNELPNIFSEAKAPRAAYEDYQVKIQDIDDPNSSHMYIDFRGIFGALNQLETYSHVGEHIEPRRLWMNYPQTINMHGNDDDKFLLKTIEGKILDLNCPQDYPIQEVDLLRKLRNYTGYPDGDGAAEVQSILAKFDSGIPVTLGVSKYYQVSPSGYHSQSEDFQYVKFCPDLTPYGVGTYLRWLQRDGSFGYWHFQNGEIGVAANEGNAFQRTVLENPAEPSEYGRVALFDRNPSQADFSESRTLNLGTYVDNSDEFDYLLGLATSPMVDRLVYLEDGEIGWQRVNVAPGSYARSRKRATPHRSAFEISIILPQRNTIKL